MMLKRTREFIRLASLVSVAVLGFLLIATCAWAEDRWRRFKLWKT